MRFGRSRRAEGGADRATPDERVLDRVTVGVVAAWIAMGGDLLGSCVYGPDVLGRSSVGNRPLLVLAAVGTLLTLALLALAYTRMVARFPHGGGGYTAAKHVLGERVALVSGVALVLDACLNVAVSVVTCVDAAAAVLPPAWSAARFPAAIGLVVVLGGLNLRGVKESVAVLAPVLLAFVASHVLVLGWALIAGADRLPGAASLASELGQLAREHGAPGTLGMTLRAYALGGAIYTGLESVSNGVPILREPKARSAARVMWLLAGVPAVVIAVILAAYLAYDVRPEGDQPMNAILFGHVAARLAGGRAGLLVAVPLLAEAALLVMAAQTGFVDGPRILGALATDRFLPKRLARLNRRLAPAPGILVVAAVALDATVVTGARLEPLIAVFVISVFVTFTISQWAMLRDAWRRRPAGRWWADAGVHLASLIACAVILGGSAVAWRAGAVVTLGLIAAVVSLSLAIRRRYDRIGEAIEQLRAEVPPPVAPPERHAPVLSPEALIARDAPIAVLVVGDRTTFARVALSWLATLAARLGGVILASVAPIDAEAVQGEERLRGLEDERWRHLRGLAEEVRRSGLPVAIELRRGADLLETAASMVADLMRGRPSPSVVVGFRSTPEGSGLDPLLRDDLAVRLQARLQRDGIPMIVASVPLEA